MSISFLNASRLKNGFFLQSRKKPKQIKNEKKFISLWLLTKNVRRSQKFFDSKGSRSRIF